MLLWSLLTIICFADCLFNHMPFQQVGYCAGTACVIGPSRLKCAMLRSALRSDNKNSIDAAKRVTFREKPLIRWRKPSFFCHSVTMGKSPCKDTKVVRRKRLNAWRAGEIRSYLPSGTSDDDVHRMELLLASANASRKALELENDVYRTLGGKYPIVWSASDAFLFRPYKKIPAVVGDSSYNHFLFNFDSPCVIKMIREDALRLIEHKPLSFTHHGLHWDPDIPDTCRCQKNIKPKDAGNDRESSEIDLHTDNASNFEPKVTEKSLPVSDRDLDCQNVAAPIRKIPDSCIQVWIGDTGASNDIVCESEVTTISLKLAKVPMIFTTANDKVKARFTAVMRLPPLGQVIAPYVLADSPALLSIGLRVVGMGWHQLWVAHKFMVMITPDGAMAAIFDLDGNIPILNKSSKLVDIRDPELTKKTGVSCAGGFVTVDIPCPYGRVNVGPKMDDKLSSKEGKRAKYEHWHERSRPWGFKLGKRRKPPKKGTANPAGESDTEPVESDAETIEVPTTSSESEEEQSETSSYSEEEKPIVSDGEEVAGPDRDPTVAGREGWYDDDGVLIFPVPEVAEGPEPVPDERAVETPPGQKDGNETPRGVPLPRTPVETKRGAARSEESADIPAGVEEDYVPPPPEPGPWAREHTRDLKAEAKTLRHLTFHGEFNKWCDGCVRGKTRDKPHYKGSFDAPTTHFGSRLTGDVTHMADAEGAPGVGGYLYAYVQQSLYGHRYCGFYLTKANRTWDVFWALKHFKGTDLWETYRSDKAKTIKRAVRALGVNWEHSQPGVSRNNALAEVLIRSFS